jgi:DNA-directed RNA polymerase subunit RPC12/RpoP
MVTYQCNKCYKIFTKKYNLEMHENRKTPCQKSSHQTPPNTAKIPPNVNLNIESVSTKTHDLPPNQYFCKFCKKQFTRKDSLSKHQNNRCKIMKNIENPLEKIYQNLLMELNQQKESQKEILTQMQKQKKEIDMLKKENKKLKRTKIINNTQNNTTNYIQINPFGDENIKKITNKGWRNIFRLNYGSIMKLIEHTHFNEKFPENSNIYISNIKSDHAMVYDGKKWNLHPRDETIENLIDNKTDCLENKFFEIIDNLDDDLKKKFTEFLDNSDDNDYINGLKNDIKLLLYNKRDIPMKLIKNNDKKIICSL